MRAARFDAPHSLRVVEMPLRLLREGEALVRVKACGVCGTDVHIVAGESRSTPPVVLGHEFAGIVEDAALAGGVFAEGDAVAIDPNISCGRCFYCRRGLVHLCENLRAHGVDIDGGMAEFCIVPVNQLSKIPSALTVEQSGFIEPVSCAVHGIDRANIRTGDTVVILGGGTIGLIMLQLARSAGAARVILSEPLAAKRAIAARLQCETVLDPSSTDILAAVRDITGVGADAVIECAGRPATMRLALSLARRGGTVEFFGVCPVGAAIEVSPNEVYANELTIVGSYVNPHTFERAIALLQSGAVRVDAFTINRFPLDGVHEALRFQKEGLTLKSIIQPDA